jgi:hypothetical protein
LQFLYENGYQHHFTCFKNQDGTPSETFIHASDKGQTMDNISCIS